MNILTNSGKVENNSSTMSQLIETATTQSLDQHATFQNLFDAINSDDKGPEEAVLSIMQRFEAGDPSAIKTALLLLDSCVQNCGNRFRRLVFSRDFLQNFVRIMEQDSDSAKKEVQTVALNLIQKWATNYQEVPELEEICKHYENRINKNVEFSVEGSEQPPQNVKPSIEIVLDKENAPSEATPGEAEGRQNNGSQSPSLGNQKNSPRLGEHRRIRCLSPKTRRGSRQLDSASAETRSRSPSPAPPPDDRRNSGKHAELLDLRATLSSHLVLGERRRSRCLSPKTRRGSRPIFLDSTTTEAEPEIERWRRRFSSQLANAAISPTRGDARRSHSSSIVHRNNNNNNHNNNGNEPLDNIESDVKYELKAFRQKCHFFAELMSVLTPGNETYFDCDHLEELSLNLTKIKIEVVRLMESPEGDGFQDELHSLRDDLDKVLLRYKDIRRASIEKGDDYSTISKTARGSLTITESDETFNEQTDLDSEHESLKTVDKQQLSDRHASVAKDANIND